MANKKGKRAGPGIWRRADSKGYLAEANYRDPKTGKRIREQKTVNRLDLAREWIQTRKADALRDQIRGREKIVPRPFKTFGDEYLEK